MFFCCTATQGLVHSTHQELQDARSHSVSHALMEDFTIELISLENIPE